LPDKPASVDAEKHEIPVCYRCGKKGQLSEDCGFKNAVCNFCKRKKVICSWSAERISSLNQVKYVAINCISDEATAAVPKPEIPVKFNGLTCTFELDTVAVRKA